MRRRDEVPPGRSPKISKDKNKLITKIYKRKKKMKHLKHLNEYNPALVSAIAGAVSGTTLELYKARQERKDRNARSAGTTGGITLHTISQNKYGKDFDELAQNEKEWCLNEYDKIKKGL